jgi:hypothetical protein
VCVWISFWVFEYVYCFYLFGTTLIVCFTVMIWVEFVYHSLFCFLIFSI